MKRFFIFMLVAVVALGAADPAFAQRRTLFDLLFGEEPAPAAPVQQQPRQQQTQQPRQTQPAAPQQPVIAPEPPPVPAVEKSPTATRLAVFGDTLAVEVSRALDRFYANDPNLVVIDQGVSSSGFVRDDFFDWNAAIEEEIAEDSFDLAVVIIGINDRQDLRVGGETYEPLTDGWNAAYQARITRFLGALRAARKPVVWIGLPPMQRADYSTDISQISAQQRLAAFSSGAEFLDIYDRYLGEDGRYSAYGPDLNGQNAQMRRDDGIHFARAGADKLAFFISQSLRTVYRGGTVTVAVADPLAGTDAAAMLRPPYQGLGQIRLLEVAGAVTPLSRAPQRASDLMLAGPPQEAAPAFSLEQLMQAPPGRVDAFGAGISGETEPAEMRAQ